MIFGKIFNSNNNPEGYIGYFNLKDWWFDTFTEEERKHMVDIFQPMGASKDTLIKGKFELLGNNSPLSFLTNLTGWFDNPRDRSLAYKIISKAEKCIDTEKEILNFHFFYPTKMKLFYKDRDSNSESLQIAIDSALKQVDIAEKAATAFMKEYPDSPLPSHEGYSQLCIILEKQGKFDEAIKYAKQAKSQGWNDDWDNRIARCHKKIEKLQKK
jgi:tetratricopeptide (TPR) repeat protein